MDSKNRKFRVAQRADEDVEEILGYTYDRWGERQFRLYEKEIEQTLSRIEADPMCGRAGHGYRIFGISAHQIFYSVTDEEILVVRVLHNSMDPQRHLDSFED